MYFFVYILYIYVKYGNVKIWNSKEKDKNAKIYLTVQKRKWGENVIINCFLKDEQRQWSNL